MKYIPVYQCDLSGNEKKYVDDCIDSTWISCKGKYVERFEKGVAGYLGAGYATACSNGTVALHLALETLGFRAGDEVIVPTFTYIASINTIVQAGATPVFADSLSDSWQVDPADIERRITPHTRAIMVVHLYGQVCDMQKIMAIADKYHLLVIEDCAEAFGSKQGSQYAGTFGDIAAFSFFGNKTITTGEGGMVVTNSEILYRKAVHLKTQGVASYRQYWHDAMAYNYRMTNLSAAIGCAQLERADTFLARKREIAHLYQKALQDLPVVLHREQVGTTHSYWMCSLLTRSQEERDVLRAYLSEHQIETRPLFYPVHLMPMYNHRYEHFPVAEDIALRGINIPSWPGLTDEQVQYICDMIHAFFAERD